MIIEKDFKDAHKGILHVPSKARFGVYVAYKFINYSLFKKIKLFEPQYILKQRTRIPDYYKVYVLVRATVMHRLMGIE